MIDIEFGTQPSQSIIMKDLQGSFRSIEKKESLDSIDSLNTTSYIGRNHFTGCTWYLTPIINPLTLYHCSQRGFRSTFDHQASEKIRSVRYSAGKQSSEQMCLLFCRVKDEWATTWVFLRRAELKNSFVIRDMTWQKEDAEKRHTKLEGNKRWKESEEKSDDLHDEEWIESKISSGRPFVIRFSSALLSCSTIIIWSRMSVDDLPEETLLRIFQYLRSYE